MIRKTILALLMAALLVVSLIGCGESKEEDKFTASTGANIEHKPTSSTGNNGEHIHDFGEWTITKQVTCEADGSRTAICSVCGETATETIMTTGHSFENDICIYCKWEKPAPSEGLEFELNKKQDAYIVTGIGSFVGNELVIPETYQDLPVTEIGKYAFERAQIISVYIPDTISFMDGGAFMDCNLLVSVAGMRNVKVMRSYAFSGCEELTEINLPSTLVYLGRQVFGGCTSLASLHIPASTTSIAGRNSSYNYTSTRADKPVNILGATNLTSLTVDPKNTVYYSSGNCIIHIADKVLIAGCANSVVPADGSVTEISEDAFRGCSELSSITLPAGITSIGVNAFEGTQLYDNLQEWEQNEDGSGRVLYINQYLIASESWSSGTLMIKEGTILIADEALTYNKMEYVTIPGTVQYLGIKAFCGCANLKEIIIPDGVTEINAGLFLNCSNLQSITLPRTIMVIGASAFGENADTVSVLFNGTMSDWNSIDISDFWGADELLNCTIYCTDGEISAA